MDEQALVSLLKARIVELEARAAEWHQIVRELTSGLLELEKRMQAQIAELNRQNAVAERHIRSVHVMTPDERRE